MSSRTSSSSNTRSVSAAVSNESVAGDSGVFEASRVLMPLNKESAQVQIALKYSKLESILSVTIERARNLTALCLPNRCQLYVKIISYFDRKHFNISQYFSDI